MSGAGESTLLAPLAERGYPTVDTDHDGWQGSDAVWDWRRMDVLLAEHHTIVVYGTAENQGLGRVTSRSGNPYGRTAEQQADITRYVVDVQPLIRRGATLELDGTWPVSPLADRIERLLTES